MTMDVHSCFESEVHILTKFEIIPSPIKISIKVYSCSDSVEYISKQSFTKLLINLCIKDSLIIKTLRRNQQVCLKCHA